MSETLGLNLSHLNDVNESNNNQNHQTVVNLLIENIRNRSVLLYGQGIYDRNKVLHKIEILSRLSLCDGSVVSPFMFMNIIRKNGLSKEFDLIIMEQAFETMKAALTNSFKYTINIHKSTIRSPDFAQKTKEALFRTGTDPSKVIFEILEEDEFTNFGYGETEATELDKLNSTLIKLKSPIGIKLSIDDFPMGSNNISAIKDYQGIDFVKLDGIWLMTMLTNYCKMYLDGEDKFIEMISSVISGIKLQFPNIIIVAERVENKYLFDLFKRIEDIKYFQGYYLGKPCEINEKSNFEIN